MRKQWLATMALVAHDGKKPALLSWARRHRSLLRELRIVSTRSTGQILRQELGLTLTQVRSGSMGGDQQIGAMIASGELDHLVFFVDPMTVHPHQQDILALIRLAILHDVPTALNPASASLMHQPIAALQPVGSGR